MTGLRHRAEKFVSGHIKFCGEPALQLMNVGIAQAKLKPGTIGVKVAIMRPDAKLPDEIEVKKPETPAETAEEKDEEVDIEVSEEKTADTKEEAVEKKEPKEAKTDDKKEGEKK